MSFITAQNSIEHRDIELKVFLKFSFQIDWNDFSLYDLMYDLMINVEKLGFGAAAEMIVNVTQTENIQECSLTALESKDNINPQELHIDVPERGVVMLTGLIYPMRTVSDVTELYENTKNFEIK